MDTLSNKDLPTIMAITDAARIAAARGEWNKVESYIQLREERLHREPLSSEQQVAIQSIDSTIAEQIKVAQAGLAALLDEAAKTRQRLQGLRRWNGAVSSDSGTIERHI